MLKHPCGAHLLAKGADVIVVKDWLGHADIKSTLVYSQIRNQQRGSGGPEDLPPGLITAAH
jgi:site-specific recombinase XerD